MNGIAALVYADMRALANDVRRILRSPGRLTLWGVYALSFALLMVSRALGSRHRGVAMVNIVGDTVAPSADALRADYFMCFLLVMLALALASGAGAIGIFRSRAEARFVIGSPLAAPFAIAYLQARESLSQGARILVSLVYFLFVFGPHQLSPFAAVADLLMVFAMIGATAAVVVPRRLLARPAGIACAVVGIPLAVLAAAPAVRDLLTQSPIALPSVVVRAAAAMPAWHPGRVLLDPQPVTLLIVLGVAAVAIAILASSGRDAYPELYALSIARIDHSERRQLRLTSQSAPRKAAARQRARPVLGAPPGVLIIVWKSIVEFRRRSSRIVVIGGAVVWCVAGFLLTHVDASIGASVLFTGILNIMIFSGLTATNSIATEMRRPLFWLSPSPLFERLCALAVGRTWRPVLTLELVAIGFVAGGGGMDELLGLSVAFPALAALQTGAGFAAFSFLPSAADARGPVVMLRLVVALVLLAPPVVLMGIVSAALKLPIAAGIGAATALALLEAVALVGIAAWRLDGHIDRLPA